MYNVTRRKLKLVTGDKGEMFVVHQNCMVIKWKIGLEEYVKLEYEDGTPVATYYPYQRDLEKLFCELTGLTQEQFVDAYRNINSRCPNCKNKKKLMEQEGFPGETLFICSNCKTVVDSILDESAIM